MTRKFYVLSHRESTVTIKTVSWLVASDLDANFQKQVKK